MNKQLATTILNEMNDEYSRIKSPKFLNIDLEHWKEKYSELADLKPFLSDLDLYKRLINGISQAISKANILEQARTQPKDLWINTSERGINKALPAIIKKPRIEIDFPYEWIDDKSGHQCSVNNGYWGARNYMVMDVLGYFYLLKEGGDCLPKERTELFQDLESIRAREAELDNDKGILVSNGDQTMLTEADIDTITSSRHWIRFDDNIFRKFTNLNLSSGDILNLLTLTSRVEFKLAFPVRLQESQKKLEEQSYIMNMFSRLFEFGYIDKRSRKSDGAVRAREYFVIFNTILGELFVHNLKMGNFEWVREDLYSLPTSAQIFFRKFILNNNFSPIPLNLQKIVQKLNLRDKIQSNLERTVVTNVLDPLKRQGFIETYSKESGLQGVKFIIKRNFSKTD
jgi:hypothetical protein